MSNCEHKNFMGWTRECPYSAGSCHGSDCQDCGEIIGRLCNVHPMFLVHSDVCLKCLKLKRIETR